MVTAPISPMKLSSKVSGLVEGVKNHLNSSTSPGQDALTFSLCEAASCLYANDFIRELDLTHVHQASKLLKVKCPARWSASLGLLDRIFFEPCSHKQVISLTSVRGLWFFFLPCLSHWLKEDHSQLESKSCLDKISMFAEYLVCRRLHVLEMVSVRLLMVQTLVAVWREQAVVYLVFLMESLHLLY